MAFLSDSAIPIENSYFLEKIYDALNFACESDASELEEQDFHQKSKSFKIPVEERMNSSKLIFQSINLC